jgi:hypothetical protein
VIRPPERDGVEEASSIAEWSQQSPGASVRQMACLRFRRSFAGQRAGPRGIHRRHLVAVGPAVAHPGIGIGRSSDSTGDRRRALAPAAVPLASGLLNLGNHSPVPPEESLLHNVDGNPACRHRQELG